MITNLNESYKLKTEISVVIHRKITVGFMPLVRTLFHVFFKILPFYSCHVTNNKKHILTKSYFVMIIVQALSLDKCETWFKS